MPKKAATLRDVANRAGVSVSTVSRLLNNRSLAWPVSQDTRKRVMAAAKALNYRPNRLARSLITDRTNIIALSLPVYAPPRRAVWRWHSIHGTFLTHLIDGVQSVMFARGYNVLLHERREYPDGETNPAADAGLDFVDGVIYAVPDPRYRQYIPVIERRMPIVMIGHDDAIGDVSRVVVDNAREVYTVVSRFIQCGHTRIGLILPLDKAATLSRKRLEGYERALAEAGIPYDDSLVIETSFDEEEAGHVTRQLLACDPAPTALFVGRASLAADALREVQAQGLHCPDDLEIAVFGDDSWFETTEPPLSAIDNAYFELGNQAANLLLATIENPDTPPREVVVPCPFVERGSTRNSRIPNKVTVKSES